MDLAVPNSLLLDVKGALGEFRDPFAFRFPKFCEFFCVTFARAPVGGDPVAAEPKVQFSASPGLCRTAPDPNRSLVAGNRHAEKCPHTPFAIAVGMAPLGDGKMESGRSPLFEA